MAGILRELRVTHPADAWLTVFDEPETRIELYQGVSVQVMGPNLMRGPIRIAGYINIEDAIYTRHYRRLDREINDRNWQRTDVEDQWDLQILFGERVYVPENWED